MACAYCKVVLMSAVESAGMPVNSRRYFGMALAAVIADQGTKFAITQWLDLGQSVALTSFFNLVHVLNSGAAFSFLAGAGGWQRYFFILLGTSISLWLAVLLHKGAPNRVEAFGYSLLLGGAMGNVIDRVWGGAVIDFLDVHVAGWHWPAFNFADIAINVAVGLLLWASFVQPTAQTDAAQ